MKNKDLPKNLNQVLFREMQIVGLPDFGKLAIVGSNNIRAIIDHLKRDEYYLSPETIVFLQSQPGLIGTKTMVRCVHDMITASIKQLEIELKDATEKPMFSKWRCVDATDASKNMIAGQKLVIVDVDNRHGRRNHPEKVFVKANFFRFMNRPQGCIEYIPVENRDNNQGSYIIQLTSPEVLLQDEFEFFEDFLTRNDYSDKENEFYKIWRMNSGLNLRLLHLTS